MIFGKFQGAIIIWSVLTYYQVYSSHIDSLKCFKDCQLQIENEPLKYSRILAKPKYDNYCLSAKLRNLELVPEKKCWAARRNYWFKKSSFNIFYQKLKQKEIFGAPNWKDKYF